MRALAHFALVALLPAAFYTPAAAAQTIALPLCTGDSQVRTVEVPLDTPGKAPEPCCVKGCHGGSSRKKAAKQFEPPQ
jgi:hypothetical protein